MKKAFILSIPFIILIIILIISINLSPITESAIIGNLSYSQGQDTSSTINPAREFCGNQGLTLDIRNGTTKGLGFCIWSDGSECEEWSYYIKECNKTDLGVRISMQTLGLLYSEAQDDTIIIDVRAASSYNASDIYTSINIPSNELSERIAEIDKTKQVIIISNNNEELISTASTLKNNDYTRIALLLT